MMGERGMDLDGKRVTVMGLGTRGGGVGVSRWLAGQGALVTVTDGQPAGVLAESIAALDGLPIRYVLGGHRDEDFRPGGADLVVRNPGVPRRAPMLETARASGVPIEMEMSLFLRHCPAPVIGITGTKGKTTTASLCAVMLGEWEPTTVLAGNMGVSALGQLGRIGPETPVVLELSSWQVEGLIEHGISPAIAVITNIHEDHLDHYDDFADYAGVKRGLVAHQGREDTAVLNAADPEVWAVANESPARVVPFATADRGGPGAWGEGDRLVWRTGSGEVVFDRPAGLALAGTHGLANALAAMAAAMSRGATPEAVATGLRGFGGVRDRLEIVGEVGGVTYINDTAATAPAATAAAMDALAGRRIHLIAGGADKRLDLAPLIAATGRAASVILLAGTATERLLPLLAAGPGEPPPSPLREMGEAVRAAARNAATGDVVLLSPGCASFGLFRDEFD
ncbi:MAG: UDP-N-acetylmuramoyl-L-alanine--D-glutamate ligase, partial [Chloroflexota bacterium]|nr:UDP-N-acetylmuramoyl-L-alanine--D-glutamate ligase [Chloroflexota bacterium]